MNKKIFIGINLILVVALVYFVMMAGTSNKGDDFSPAPGSIDKTLLPTSQSPLSILSYVPSDTLFFFGGLEPAPLVSMFQGLISHKDINRMIESVHDQGGHDTDELSPEPGLAPSALMMLFGMAMEYLKVENDVELLAKKLGIGQDVDSAFYSLGHTPVMRVKLLDTKAFNAYIDASEVSGNVTAKTEVINGTVFRAYSLSGFGDNEVLWSPYNFYITAHDDYAVFFIATAQELLANVAIFLGDEKPPLSISQTATLESLIEEYQFDPKGLGYLNELAVLEALTQPGATANPLIDMYANMTIVGGFLLEIMAGVELMTTDEPDLSEEDLKRLQQTLRTPACHKDVVAMARMFPRSVSGYREYDVNQLPMKFNFVTITEVDNEELLTDLRSLRGFVSSELRALPEDAMLGLGIGLDIGALLPLLSKTLQSVSAAEYTCEPLLRMQSVVNEYSGQIMMGTAAISGMVSSIKGASVSLYELDMTRLPESNEMALTRLDILISLSAENPSTLLMMAAGLLPPLGSLEVPEDGRPVDFPIPMPWPELGQVKIAIKGPHIVVYLGEKSAALAERLFVEPLDQNVMMASSLDTKAVMSKVLAEVMGGDGESENVNKEDLLNVISILSRLNAKVNFQYDITPLGLSSTVKMVYQVDAVEPN